MTAPARIDRLREAYGDRELVFVLEPSVGDKVVHIAIRLLCDWEDEHPGEQPERYKICWITLDEATEMGWVPA